MKKYKRKTNKMNMKKMVNQTRKRRRIRRIMRGGMEKASQLTPKQAYDKFMKGEYLNDEEFMMAIMEKGEKDPMSKIYDMRIQLKSEIKKLESDKNKALRLLRLKKQEAMKALKDGNRAKADILITAAEKINGIVSSYEPHINMLEINLAKIESLISKSKTKQMLAKSVGEPNKFIRDTTARLGNESIAEMTTDFEKMLKDTGVQQERQLEQMKKVSSVVDPDEVAELMVQAEDEVAADLVSQFPDVPKSGPTESQGAQLKKRSRRKSKSKRKAKSKRRILMSN